MRLRIGRDPHDAEVDTRLLLRWAEGLHAEQTRFMGFPANLSFDFAALAPLLTILVNNVGDPGSTDASGIHAKAYEKAVVDFFAEVAGIGAEQVYGYVTTGGSEGNLYGLATARDYLPNARLYASDQAHYSVRKAAHLLQLPLTVIRSRPDGSMDPRDLTTRVAEQCPTGPPGSSLTGAIVLATAGTTMLGAYDNVGVLRTAAASAGKVYVHVDAALGGLVAAHAPSRPSWTFRHGADSVSISGHKMVGVPMACGVVLVRDELVAQAAGPEYVLTSDRTLSCSRSGLASLLMWAALRQAGRDGIRKRVLTCLQTAEYAEAALRAAGARPFRPVDSLIVTFDRPTPETVARYHLACEGDRAHLVAMPHVSRALVDALSADMKRDLAVFACARGSSAGA
ncbi:histidine decarboxylase [Streptomyces sp. NPDC054865]